MCIILNRSVHLVELLGTGEYFAMKAMDKSVMLNRNKVGVTNFVTYEILDITVFNCFFIYLSNTSRSIE